MKMVKVDKVDEMLFQEIIKRIVAVINPLKIILFGSWAYGIPTKSSDLDILVIVDNDIVSRRKISSEIYGVLRDILISKDIIVVKLSDIEEWKNVTQSFITKIMDKGKVIYER